MHPKNPYKIPPDFKELSLKYPEFRKYAKPDLAGKILIDFKDPAALRALTASLLHRDFNLDVVIPENRLVPTLPLRLNYILWVEDLLQLDPLKNEEVWGVDIGCGACCIYPLLAARLKNWKFLATEVEEINYQSALENVRRNNLENKITIKPVDSEASLLEGNIEDLNYSFCMTNPPFFDNNNEKGDSPSKRKNRPEPSCPKLGGSASLSETSFAGGEVEFVKKLINESLRLKMQIRVFTSLLGRKASLSPLKNYLRDLGISNFCQTEFAQGKTMRWGLAWTFREEIQLKATPTYAEPKLKPPITHIIEDLSKFEQPNVSSVAKKLREVFAGLKMVVKVLKKNKYMELMEVAAFENTWSHSRRRRREAERDQKAKDAEPPLKKPSLEEVSIEVEMLRPGESSSEIAKSETREPITSFKVRLQWSDPVIVMQLDFLKGSLGRDSLQQILQYLKNNVFK